MPTIITKGQLPSERRYRKTCSNCGTVFECAHSELRTSPDQREVGWEITCPLPGCRTTAYPSPKDLVAPNAAPPKLHFPPGCRSAELRPSDVPNYYRDH